jgi:lectin-like protein
MKRLLAYLPALVVFGCWGPQDSTLFSPDGTPSRLNGAGAVGGATNVAGAGSGSGDRSGSGTAGDVDVSPTTGGSGYDTGGGGNASAATAGGGAGPLGGAGSSALGSAGEGGHPEPIPVIENCEVMAGAVTNEANGHCYRVNLDELDFAAASEACRTAGAHLVTASSEAENSYVHGLLEAEHWLGATDELPDTTQGVGTYVWVNDEPWDYDDWLDGQPNAKETACPSEEGDSSCFEHCGYQSDDGSWVDRPCWHQIASVCEWEIEGLTKD